MIAPTTVSNLTNLIILPPHKRTTATPTINFWAPTPPQAPLTTLTFWPAVFRIFGLV